MKFFNEAYKIYFNTLTATCTTGGAIAANRYRNTRPKGFPQRHDFAAALQLVQYQQWRVDFSVDHSLSTHVCNE